MKYFFLMGSTHVLTWVIIAGSAFCRSPQRAQCREQIEAYLNRFEQQGFSGAVLVAKDGDILISKGYGLSNRDLKTPVTEATVFTIGSITKQFTAAAILKLQMMGKLNVNDRLSLYIENVPNDKQHITIHHLLTHTAGFPGAIGDDFDPVDADDFISLAMTTPLMYPPGSTYAYSNVGYSLLGIIVETVSGMSYEHFLHESLFAPAGMASTGYAIPRWKPEMLAHGYRGDTDWGTLRDHPWTDNGPGWHLRANGGILSTVMDMYRWHLALNDNRILSDSMKAMMFTPHVREGKDADSFYGYGWALFETDWNTRLIAHNGGNTIFAADFHRYVDDNVVIIALSNTANKTAITASEFIARIVFNRPYSLPLAEPIPLDEKKLKDSEIGRRALELVKSMGEDMDRASRFVHRNFTPEKIAQAGERLIRFMRQKDGELGRINLYRAMQTGERTIELTVQSRDSQMWWLLTLEFDTRQPHYITGIYVDHTPPPTGTDSNENGTSSEWGLPHSETGGRASALLDALKSGTPEGIRNFVTTQLTPDCLLEPAAKDASAFLMKWHKTIGSPLLRGAMKTGPYSARLHVESGNSNTSFIIRFWLDAERPHRIRRMVIESMEQRGW